jgi:hypothetical protein
MLQVGVFLTLALAVQTAWAHGPRGLDVRSEQGADPVLVPAEPTVPPDSAPWVERTADPRPVERSGVGALEGIGIAAVVLGLVGLRRSPRRDRQTAIAAITAALLVGFILEITPHLVHHSLDSDGGAGCEALQTAERSHAAAGMVDATPVQMYADVPEASLDATPPASTIPAPRGRAPPA